MPLYPLAPHIRILEAARLGVAAIAAADWLESTGREINTVRHARNRYPTRSERATVSLRWAGNEDHDVDGYYLNSQERPRRCNIDVEIDLSLRPENSGDDPTGWGDHGRVQARLMDALRDPAGPLMQLCDWVIDGDEDPDEDSKPDEGRLVKRISVVYRVRTDDPNVLLARGENG